MGSNHSRSGIRAPEPVGARTGRFKSQQRTSTRNSQRPMREPSGAWIPAQDIETARAILAKVQQETKNQNSFRGSRLGSLRSQNESIPGKRKLSFASDRKPRSSGILKNCYGYIDVGDGCW